MAAPSSTPNAQAKCENCFIDPVGFQVYSNGTFTGADSDSQLPTTGFFCTAYKSFSATHAIGNDCTTSSTFISLSRPFYVVLATTSLETPSLSLSAFTSSLDFADCPFSSLATGTIGTSFDPNNFPTYLTQTLIPQQPTATTYSSSTSQLTLIPQPTATAYSSSTSQLTPTKSSPSQYTQGASAHSGETIKLIIGLVIAITALILLVTVVLGSWCMIRKRRRWKNTCIATHQAASDTSNEKQDPQMYIGLKVELDDEQRKHELEVTDTRYELEGSGMIQEIAGEKMEFLSGRHESSGDEYSEGLDKPS